MRTTIVLAVLLLFIAHCAMATQYVIYVREPLVAPQLSALSAVATAAAPVNASGSSLWQTADDADETQLGAALAAAFPEVKIAGETVAERRRTVLDGAHTVIIDTVKAVSKPRTPPPDEEGAAGGGGAAKRQAPVRPDAVASWGLDRVDQRPLPLNSNYAPDRTGAGVTVWVVDTGLDAAHAEFGGRASMVFSTYSPATDCDGHGTHVAGTIGGTTVGVARLAALRGVKVLDCNGAGSTLTVAQGLQYVWANRAANRNVVNMSFGFNGRDYVIEAILQDLFNAGVFLVAAAGNDGGTACSHFPSGYSTVVAVAASTQQDARASYSNYGSCVDLFAPGSGIVSAKLNGGTQTMSGTSMASPHVAGYGALMLQAAQQAPNLLIATMTTRSTINLISGANGSPNKLLFVLLDTNPSQPNGGTSTTASTSSSSTTSSSTTASTTTSGSTTSGAARHAICLPLLVVVPFLYFCADLAASVADVARRRPLRHIM